MLRAIRETRGVTQAGWAAWLGVSRRTVHRWEKGGAVPDNYAEQAILRVCRERGLFRAFEHGPLQGVMFTPELLAELLADARLQTRNAERGARSGAPGQAPVPRFTRLPMRATSFIGREREVAEVRELLRSHRLLTLTGTGGVGKTRLALEASAGPLPHHPDGAWLVELAALTDPALVPQAVAAALEVREAPGHPLIDTLIAHLQDRRVLLVLDNCEHLVAACAALTEALIERCPGLRLLATSREALGVTGELRWRVPSLSAPDARAAEPPARLLAYESVRLFNDRAALAAPGFLVTRQNVAAVAQICRRLDGIPLAIELAAVRVNVLSVAQIAARLDDRFRLLTSGSRTALPRQQTLQAMIDWSHDLLTEPERVAWRRLSIFAGSFDLAAAEAVCGETGQGTGDKRQEDPVTPPFTVPYPLSPVPSVLDLVARLVETSLVMVERQGEVVRYRMLETIQAYGREKLAAAGETESVSRRHRDWYLALVEGEAPDQARAEARLEQEHDNLRAALAWCLQEPGSAEPGLRLAAALGPFWDDRGHVSEGLDWLRRLLAAGRDASPIIRAHALEQAGRLAWEQADFTQSETFLNESLALYRALDDKAGAARSLIVLGRLAMVRGDRAGALSLLCESLELYHELGDEGGVADALGRLGSAAYWQGDLEGARRYAEEGLARLRALGDERGMLVALQVLARIANRERNHEQAAALHEQALAVARGEGMEGELADVLIEAGVTMMRLGRPDTAVAYQREGLALYRQRGTRVGMLMALAALGDTLVTMGQMERGVRLWGAAVALRASLAIPSAPGAPGTDRRFATAAREALGADAYDTAWQTGRAASLDEALAEALDDGDHA